MALASVVAALVAASVFLFQSRAPEDIFVPSDDGRVRVQGWGIAGDHALSISRLAEEDAWKEFLLTSAYLIRETGGPKSSFTLTFFLNEQEWLAYPSAAYVLYRYQPVLGAWEQIPSQTDESKRTISAQVLLDGDSQWAIGTMVAQPDPSSYTTVFDALRAAPPPGAVGYRSFLAVADKSIFQLVSDQVDVGGCDGSFVAGNSTVLTLKDQPTDDARSLLRFGILWEIKEGGCQSGQKIFSSRTRS